VELNSYLAEYDHNYSLSDFQKYINRVQELEKSLDALNQVLANERTINSRQQEIIRALEKRLTLKSGESVTSVRTSTSQSSAGSVHYDSSHRYTAK
jgi:uncharacterized coiled-coil protein SlyX